jgi:hypothetical protein
MRETEGRKTLRQHKERHKKATHERKKQKGEVGMLPAPTARLEGQNDEKEGGGTTHTPGYGSPFLASTWSALASHYPDAFPMSAEDGGEKDAFFGAAKPYMI